jgi:[acyl-carrier-protein] S-malonyltransferase
VLAFLFPGQGSQVLGMGRDVCAVSPAARAVFEAADRALAFPLSRVCFEGPEAELLRTEIQQPAVLTASVALLRALEERGTPKPVCVAGHSLGEYSALVASGALSLEVAVRLVHARGRFMQEAVPEGEGAMAAVVGCGPQIVEEACARARAQTGGCVETANFNAPEQTVISGHRAAVDAACAMAREAGARRAIRLPVSAPFHCSLMEPAGRRLLDELSRVTFADPVPPVVANATARPNAEAGRIAELLRRQVTAPVRFTEMVEAMAALGVTRFLEIGPGRVLSALVARIDRRLSRANLGSAEELEKAAAFAGAA